MSEDEYVIWKSGSKNKKIKASQVRKVDTMKFKAHGDVLSFASKHPGALSGFFLSMCHQKISQGTVHESKQLARVPMTVWAQQHSGLSELRDLREVQTLALAMELISRKELAQAMDVLAMRIQAIQAAKGKGGSWEKASRAELIMQSGVPSAASGLLKLTS